MFPRTLPVYIIAEAGVNHNGREEKARLLIDIAVASRANAVKFQMFSPTALTTGSAPKARYQAKNLHDDRVSQRAMLEKLTLPPEAFKRLSEQCTRQNIDFLCTPFDKESLAYLVTHTRMPYLKLPSGEVTNGPFLLAAARTGLPIILSTGMSSLEEVSIALSVLHFGYTNASGYPHTLAQPTADMLKALQGKVTLMHCVSQYPAPPESSNLLAIQTMKEAFGLPVGLSDHTLGFDVAVAAVHLGASVIEKHFTYDPGAEGPDHAASLTAGELTAMITAIRSGSTPVIEESWLGDGKKRCQEVELDTRNVARRSVVAGGVITKGTPFSEANLTCKRPSSGPVPPNRLWELLGKPAKHDYAADDFIDIKELE